MSDELFQALDAFPQEDLPEVKRGIMRIKDLAFAPYNPRIDIKPGDEVYENLKKSILTFGLVDKGIVFNVRTNTMVGGHQRVKVLKDMFGDMYRVEVSLVDLPIGKEKALNLALNKIENDWEPVKLQNLLKDLSNNFIDELEFTGFSPKEIDKYLKPIEEEDIVEGDGDFEMFHDVKTNMKCPKCGYMFSEK